METSVLTLLIGLIFFELFEISWQQGSTIHAYLYNLVRLYRKSLLLFILGHPSFYYVIFCSLLWSYNSLFAGLLVGIKLIDLSIKLVLVERLSNGKHLGIYAPLTLTDQPFPWFMKLLPALFYGMLFFGAFA
jgi:hypothetical protein